jgi:hypothetical protein
VWARPGQAFRTATPECDLGFVDLITTVIDRRQTGSRTNRAIDIDHTAADSADQMMMVVADTTLEPSRRAGGLDTADEAAIDQDS